MHYQSKTDGMSSYWEYSDKYADEEFEYRCVSGEKTSDYRKGRVLRSARRDKQLYTEEEWRKQGIQMSRGWQHYGWFPKAEIPNFRTDLTLLFRRRLGTDPTTGKVEDPALAEVAREKFRKQYYE